MKIYIVHEVEVDEDTTAAEAMACIKTASDNFKEAIRPVARSSRLAAMRGKAVTQNGGTVIRLSGRV